jgi:para-nitrobenzyl esterase
MALDWVGREIHAFGGDAQQVTLMGHSSGAAAVSLLTMMPVVEGKFARAIILSG